MPQRYFLTTEATYETLRQGLNTQLAYPNSLGKSVFQTALYAPRDGFRRILLAVDTGISNYAAISSAISPLLDTDAAEEIDEATYLAAVASATAGASAWNDITGKPTEFPPASHTQPWSTITSTPTTRSGYGITDAQAASPYLDQFASASAAIDGSATSFVYWYDNASASVSTSTVTAFGRSLIDDASASVARTTLGLGSLATQSSVAYSSLTGTPSTFAPSAHKSSHATGGADALTASDIGAAATSHTHVHSDVGNSPATLSQFTASQNNLSLGTGGIVRISSNAAVNITSIAATSAGDARLLSNVGSFAITLKHSDSAQTAANRILCVGNADVVIQAGGSAVVYYDGTDSRWRCG